jgi:hypothetical protein
VKDRGRCLYYWIVASIEGSELWIDNYDWEDEPPTPVPTDAETTPEHRYQPSLSKRLKEVLIFAGAATVAAAALVTWGELKKPESQTPTFAATKVEGCYISDNWKWVKAREGTGLDDLVIRNVDGPTSESGKGARCLEAAKLVIAKWADQDDIPGNNMYPLLYGDSLAATVYDDEWYAVPYFATTKPQG